MYHLGSIFTEQSSQNSHDARTSYDFSELDTYFNIQAFARSSSDPAVDSVPYPNAVTVKKTKLQTESNLSDITNNCVRHFYRWFDIRWSETMTTKTWWMHHVIWHYLICILYMIIYQSVNDFKNYCINNQYILVISIFINEYKSVYKSVYKSRRLCYHYSLQNTLAFILLHSICTSIHIMAIPTTSIIMPKNWPNGTYFPSQSRHSPRHSPRFLFIQRW